MKFKRLMMWLSGALIAPGLCMLAQEGTIKDNTPINKILNMSYLPHIINTSVEAGIFEALNGASLSSLELAEKLNLKEQVTDALLIVLDAAKLIQYNDGKYSLTLETAKNLLASEPNNQIDFLSANTAVVNGPLKNLKTALSGETPKSSPQKQSFSNWQQKAFLISRKNSVNTNEGPVITDFITALPEFKDDRKMIDYAGSIGYYTMPLLDKNPKLEAHVYDLPEVCEIAREVQKEETHFDRVTFHGFDMRSNDSVGSGYDLFFVSNALYGQRTKEELLKFFTKANKSMQMGGVLVSNHRTNQRSHENYLNLTIAELTRSLQGRPVHFIELETLKAALLEAGFDNMTIKITNEATATPSLLLAARKVKEL
jgi:predicted O-methyltransferase YrrM